MSTQIGTPQAVQFQTAHYLFRVYHEPIRATEFAGQVWDWEWEGWVDSPRPAGFELNYNDYLMSLPPTDEDFINCANQLAYAESLLYVNDSIPFIAAWLVCEGMPIDEAAPVRILHPFNGLHQSQMFREVTAAALGVDLMAYETAEQLADYKPHSYLEMPGFQSFDLHYLPPMEAPLDPFLVLDVTREAEYGPTAHKWFKGVMCKGDCYRSDKGNLVLALEGTLYRLRFPWYQATLSAMPYTHEGFQLNRDGSVKPGKNLLTNRVANLAVDAAELRRQFMRHSENLQNVYRVWWRVMNEVSKLLREIEMGNPPVLNYADYTADGGPTFNFLSVDPTKISEVLYLIQEFVNFAARMGGSIGPAFKSPFQELNAMGESYLARVALQDVQGYPSWYMVQKEESHAWRIMHAMCDLLGACWASIKWEQDAFTRANVEFMQEYPLADNIRYMHVAMKYAMAENQFVLDYATMQGNLQALFGLMASWQYAFMPHEVTRGSGVEDAIRYRQPKTKRLYDFDARRRENAEAIEAPHIVGRVAWDYPRFAPSAMWDVSMIPGTVDSTYINQLRLNMLVMITDAHLARDAEEAAAKAARKAAREAQIAQMQADASLFSNVDPYDVWDWRNWSNKKWWLTTVPVDQIGNFAANAENTVGVIQAAGEIFGLSPKVINNLKRIEPLINLVSVLIVPSIVLRNYVRSNYIRQLVLIGASQIVSAMQSKARGAAITRALQPTTTLHPHYGERHFWPTNPDEPQPDGTDDTGTQFPSRFSDPTIGGGAGGGGGGAF